MESKPTLLVKPLIKCIGCESISESDLCEECINLMNSNVTNNIVPSINNTIFPDISNTELSISRHSSEEDIFSISSNESDTIEISNVDQNVHGTSDFVTETSFSEYSEYIDISSYSSSVEDISLIDKEIIVISDSDETEQI